MGISEHVSVLAAFDFDFLLIESFANFWMVEMFLHRRESIASIAMTLMSKNSVGCGCAFGQHCPIVFTRPMECNRRDFASFQHFGICEKWTVIKAQRCCPLMKSFSIIDAYKCAHLQAQKLHDFSESPWANHSMR